MGLCVVGVLMFCIYIVLFAPTILEHFLSSEEFRTACYDMSNEDATKAIEQSLKKKAVQSPDGTAIFGRTLDDMRLLRIDRDIGERGKGTFSIELEYSDMLNISPLFKAVIYEDCDIQWIALSNTVSH